jgi:hypothetical protein
MDEECDRCGTKFPPHAVGANHGYPGLCHRCGDLMHAGFGTVSARCDYCGDDIDPANPGQSTADTVLCAGCTREAAKWAEDEPPPRNMPSADLVTGPDHVVSGPPAEDFPAADFDLDDEEPEEATPLADDDYHRDRGEPVGEYDDARNLNAADLMAEIRRMS